MKKMSCFHRLKNSGIYAISLLNILILTGCSFSNTSKNKSSNNNVAYAVPEKVATEDVDLRRKPTRPSWTEGFSENVAVNTDKNVRSEIYIVRKGDTLYGIARNFGISIRELMDLNGMDNNTKLSIGQKIKLPGKLVDVEMVADKSAGRKVSIYTVQPGDSLYKIARAHSMTVNEIKTLNEVSSDRIYVGQTLQVFEKTNLSSPSVKNELNTNDTKTVPAQRTFKADNDGYYTIQAGDTLGRIAHGFRISVEQLKEVNGITDPTKLQIGKKLIIPNAQYVVNKPIMTHYEPEQVLSRSTQSEPEQVIPESSDLQSTEPLNDSKPASDDFFENFDEIPVVKINN